LWRTVQDVTDTLREVIGAQVRAIREQHGKRQDDIAVAARGYGLRWSASRVAGLERGDKAIPVEEFLLLPSILQWADCGRPTLADLLPDSGEDFVAVAGDTTVRRRALRSLVIEPGGELLLRDFTMPSALTRTQAKRIHAQLAALPAQWDDIEAVGLPDDARGWVVDQIRVDASREAEQIAARRFGVSPTTLATIAFKTWGRGLTAERDARVQAVAAPDAQARSLQALRGRTTRLLYQEIEPAIADHAKRTSKRKGRR
jgi:transcriptional regulator with XRE-family HTH domain